MKPAACVPLLHGAMVLALATAMPWAAGADTDKRLPLGLYQIDTEATMGAPSGSYRIDSRVD